MEASHFTTAGQIRKIASAGKVIACVFWDSEGVLMTDYLERGKTVTGIYYAEPLRTPEVLHLNIYQTREFTIYDDSLFPI